MGAIEELKPTLEVIGLAVAALIVIPLGISGIVVAWDLAFEIVTKELL